MDVFSAISLLKKYKMYDDAERECRRRGIDKAPYDMQGHHEIYCQFHSKKWVELRDKRDCLLKIRRVEWDNIPDEMKRVHDECNFVGVCSTKEYCRTKCAQQIFYQSNDLIPAML